MLLKQPARADDRSTQVRIAWGGGCPLEVGTRSAERFGVRMREGYGLSEMITFVTINHRRPGRLHRQAAVVFRRQAADEQGERVGTGETGEFSCARASRAAFSRLLPSTRRRARSNARRLVLHRRSRAQGRRRMAVLRGRSKDMVRRRGINISAWEVERVSASTQAIEECALVGVPSDLGDDELKLFVRLVPGAQLDPAVFAAGARRACRTSRFPATSSSSTSSRRRPPSASARTSFHARSTAHST
jgi:crotonobetaine/carnitine-CoA ligase